MHHKMSSASGKFSEEKCPSVEISWWRPSTWMKWTSPSILNLIKAEKAVLSDVWDKIERKYTPIMNGNQHIHSIVLNSSSNNTPILLLHGMGSGVGLWSMNLRSLSSNRPVYAIDILGFGASSRHQFGKDALSIESEFINSIEEWREETGIDKFIMVGHSMGGFLSAAYALQYPSRLMHLVLVDPWGISERPTTSSPSRTPMPMWIHLLAGAMQNFNPLALLRAAGPYGASVVSFFRTDLIGKFDTSSATISDYIYNCNAHTPTGEEAFIRMSIPIGWAKHPMIKRIADIQPSVQMTMMYGSRSWIDNAVGWQIKYMRENSYVDVQIFKGAGHHLYADKSEEFNTAINKIARTVDLEVEQGFSAFTINRRRRVQSENTLTYAVSPLSTSTPYVNRYIQSETSIEEKCEERIKVQQFIKVVSAVLDEEKPQFTCGPEDLANKTI